MTKLLVVFAVLFYFAKNVDAISLGSLFRSANLLPAERDDGHRHLTETNTGKLAADAMNTSKDAIQTAAEAESNRITKNRNYNSNKVAVFANERSPTSKSSTGDSSGSDTSSATSSDYEDDAEYYNGHEDPIDTQLSKTGSIINKPIWVKTGDMRMAPILVTVGPVNGRGVASTAKEHAEIEESDNVIKGKGYATEDVSTSSGYKETNERLKQEKLTLIHAAAAAAEKEKTDSGIKEYLAAVTKEKAADVGGKEAYTSEDTPATATASAAKYEPSTATAEYAKNDKHDSDYSHK